MSTYLLKVSIQGTDPLVYRTIELPDNITFHQFHLVLQECFQWKDYHLYEFDVPGLGKVSRDWGDNDPWGEDEGSTDSLETLIDPYMGTGSRLTYTYDLGDEWVHVVDVVFVNPRGTLRWPIVTGWQGQSLIEDCGGVGGYYETMRILEDRSDPEYRSTSEWVRFNAPSPFDNKAVSDIMSERLYFPKAAYQDILRERLAEAADARPAVSLKDAVDHLDMQGFDSYAYVNLDTGELDIVFTDGDAVGQDEADDSEERFEACNALGLPGPEELEDYRAMRDFALSQEGVAGERLSAAIEGRGAFKRFKSMVHQLDLADEWYAYRDEFRAELLKSYFVAHGVRWK